MLNFYRQVITEAMQKLLIPDAIKALRKDMIEVGQKKVLQVIEDKFWCEATMPPLRLQYVAESPDDTPEVPSQHTSACPLLPTVVDKATAPGFACEGFA